jgi:hypothetical protein
MAYLESATRRPRTLYRYREVRYGVEHSQILEYLASRQSSNIFSRQHDTRFLSDTARCQGPGDSAEFDAL